MVKKIGLIGQGWIGKNYANDFENRGLSVVRYALEAPYNKNEALIKECDIVFIAVPTPTTPDGFDDSILRKVIKLIGDGKTAVIKSTITLGTTESIQKDNQNIFVVHSPEFLTEATAIYDAANPNRNIVGIPNMTDEYKNKAQDVINILPKAPYEKICSAREAELIKYGGNVFLYFKVIYANILYDLARQAGCKWEVIRDSMIADPRIGETHLDPIHKSGRGAGGHCFIKDFAAFAEMYEKNVGDKAGVDALRMLEKKNIELLLNSNKDLDLLKSIYSSKILNESNDEN